MLYECNGGVSCGSHGLGLWFSVWALGFKRVQNFNDLQALQVSRVAVAVAGPVIQRALNPKPSTLNPKPQTLPPKPQTLNPKPHKGATFSPGVERKGSMITVNHTKHLGRFGV